MQRLVFEACKSPSQVWMMIWAGILEVFQA
jgi:hypothetical protein